MRDPRQPYFGALDGLRALSVIAVVWHHTRPSDWGAPIATRGYLGVDVFFVISGFLITTLLLREEAARGSVRLGRFWARRALRLFPLWYALLFALGIVFGFVLPNSPMAGPFFDELAYNATYTSNLIIGSTILSVSWSLALEEQFYLVWPTLLTRLSSAVVPALLLTSGLSIGVHAGAFDHLFERWIGDDWKQYAALTATPLPLVLGCTAALVRRGSGATHRAWSVAFAPRTTTLWLLVLVAVALAPVRESWMRLAAQLAATGVVLSCLSGPHAVLEVRGMRWFGERAYGVYLLHMPCREVLFALGLAPDGRRGLEVFAATLAVTAVAAGLSYRLLELPFLRLKSRFR